ncbi:hypothetical protein M434DRAFT_401940 [Hypoxylon sp. CO27-5]|nr:hypothetical protein M434DRAFT_401940 [Hypoxylon sp. CO27-5]
MERYLWDCVSKLRAISRPGELSRLISIDAAQTDHPVLPSDVLIQGLCSHSAQVLDDDALRNQIYERYIHFNDRLYKGTLSDILHR